MALQREKDLTWDNGKKATRGSHKPFKRDFPKPKRNDKCPCGSGLKYKRCCLI